MVMKKKRKMFIMVCNHLTGNDVAEAVIFCATRPPHANINSLIITPSVQANSFFIDRK